MKAVGLDVHPGDLPMVLGNLVDSEAAYEFLEPFEIGDACEALLIEQEVPWNRWTWQDLGRFRLAKVPSDGRLRLEALRFTGLWAERLARRALVDGDYAEASRWYRADIALSAYYNASVELPRFLRSFSSYVGLRCLAWRCKWEIPVFYELSLEEREEVEREAWNEINVLWDVAYDDEWQNPLVERPSGP